MATNAKKRREDNDIESGKQRNRSTNFTSLEVDVLIVSSFLRKKTLGYGTSIEKKEALLEVTRAVNIIGGHNRTPEQCADRLHRDKMKVKSKVQDALKTMNKTGGGHAADFMSPSEELLHSTLERTQVEGFEGIDTSDIYLMDNTTWTVEEKKKFFALSKKAKTFVKNSLAGKYVTLSKNKKDLNDCTILNENTENKKNSETALVPTEPINQPSTPNNSGVSYESDSQAGIPALESSIETMLPKNTPQRKDNPLFETNSSDNNKMSDKERLFKLEERKITALEELNNTLKEAISLFKILNDIN